MVYDEDLEVARAYGVNRNAASEEELFQIADEAYKQRQLDAINAGNEREQRQLRARAKVKARQAESVRSNISDTTVNQGRVL